MQNQITIKFWELIVFTTEAVIHNCSSKWPEWLSIAKIDQMKQKDILRKDRYEHFC